MQKKMKLLFGLTLSVGFVFLGFYLLNDVVEKSNYPTLIKVVGFLNIIIFGFLGITAVLGLFGNNYIPKKIGLIKPIEKS